MLTGMKLAQTLGQLDRQRFPARSVRDELRANLIRKLRSGDTLFPGIVGYEDSVIPQLSNALLARHDLILLGLRGQSKTRLARLLVELLDDAIPMIAGSPLREHPLAPQTSACRAMVEEAGDDLPIEWLERRDRYGEKLATPDVSVADLIGDIDPLKAAHRKLDLSNEEVIHYGIVPRTNHGIFCINELPDLAPRIQVALLNLLEEQDIQIRGFPLRIPLDVQMIFTANPEDYTNRGSIITPLKDRIASQINTHYPRSTAQARSISEDQAWSVRDGMPQIVIPDFVADLLELIAFQGRDSEYIDQKSGVSARLPIAARELLISQVERRLLRHPEDPPYPRILDCYQLLPAITGKVELVYEGEQEGPGKVARHLIGAACRALFDQLFPAAIESDDIPSPKDDSYKPVLEHFARGETVDLDDEEDFASYQHTLEQVPGLGTIVDAAIDGADDAVRATAMELVLEGLHQHSLLSKVDLESGSSYGDMLRSMLGNSL